MDFRDMTVAAFAQGIGAETPLAGGGSVSALAGSYGAALVAMVSRKTILNKKYADVADHFLDVIQQCAPLRENLLDGIQGDITSFRKFKTALAMPKETAEEQAARKAAMQEGLKAAIKAPLDVAEWCAQLLPLCRDTVENGNKNAASDALVGVLMLRTAILGAVYNIRINLQSITDESYKEAMLCRADELQKLAIGEESAILELVPELTRCQS